MARRVAQRAESEESSGPSPAPEVIEAPAAPTARNGTTAASRKRKRGTATPGNAIGDAKETGLQAEPEQTRVVVSPKRQSKAKAKAPKKEIGTTVTKVKSEGTEDVVAPTDKGVSEPPKNSRKRKAVEYKEEEEDEDVEPVTKKAPKKRKTTKSEAEDTKVDENGDPVAEKKVVRKRKTKEEKESEAMPLAARTVGHKMFIGAHVSAAGGVHNAVTNSVHIGANAFALFLKSQRKWANPPLDQTHCTAFHDNCAAHSYSANKNVVPHGSYLVNLAHTDPARTTQAYDTFVDDLHRCERLGITLYNFHPGNVAGSPRAEAIAHLAANLNRAHKETKGVVTLLENMAAGGNVIGSTFEDLRDVIALVEDKSRVGVCLDTCHAFAAGYDLRDRKALEETLGVFDRTVGIGYLRALHLNDSKAPFASHRDLHANIGTGFLGLRAFHAVVNEARFEGLPMVLETPIEVRDEDGVLVKDEKGKPQEDKGIWATEIKMLEGLVGVDVDSEEFLASEKALQRKGLGERKRVGEQVEKREVKAKEKAEKGAGKGGKKGKKAKKEEQSEESSLSDLEEE